MLKQTPGRAHSQGWLGLKQGKFVLSTPQGKQIVPAHLVLYTNQ
jgi:hypothetical protein